MATLALVEGSPDGNEDASLRLDEFTQHLLSSGRAKSYRAAIGAFASWHRKHEPGPLAMAAVTPLCVRSYRDHLRDEAHKSASTIDVRLAALRAYYGYLRGLGHTDKDPSVDVHAPRAGRQAPKALDKAAGGARQRNYWWVLRWDASEAWETRMIAGRAAGVLRSLHLWG
jgi:hypothetical protein